MATNNARLFAPISKVEEQDDGTVKVWGYASAESVDSDGETITADAMKAALPDYLKFGAVREMHQAKAAGTAIEAEVQADGRTFFGAHIVDTEAVKKVRANVYKGFSVGGRVTSRDDVVKTTITGLKLVEVSLVDRPANPDAVFTMFKAETELTAVEELAKMVNDGLVTPEQLVELAKAAQTGDAGAETAKADDATDDGTGAETLVSEPLRKGMWDVERFADLLGSLASMARNSACEAKWEQDGSPVPAKLRAWVGEGAAIFAEMAAEEVAEMLAGLALEGEETAVIALADEATDLTKGEMTDDGFAAAADAFLAAGAVIAKAGARNSAADAKRLQDIHDMAIAMGAACGEGEKVKADAVEDIAKVNLGDELAKALAPLAKRIAELEAQPAAPKAILKVVGKEADGIDTTKAEDEIDTTGMTPEQVALAEVKKLHKMGGKSLI